MMPKKAVGFIAGTLWAASLGFSASPAKLSGSIVGLVSDASGIPQMGATVLLYNRFDKLIHKVLTNENGTFGFDALSPEVYAIRVSVPSFLPALKRNIVVQPGMQSLLNVNLASVFSSIELVAIAPGESSLMSEEWKWVLRSSSATRPILRYLPKLSEPKVAASKPHTPAFSSTRGLVQVSAGDQTTSSALGNSPDLGTAFALATSFMGKNKVQVSGNVGYASASGMPTAAFRTSFQREMPDGTAPAVQVTMRQVLLSNRAGGEPIGEAQGAPVMRTLSASLSDEARLGGMARLEYGFTMDSVSFLDRLNYFSPWARLTYNLGHNQALEVGYASGAPPLQLLARDGESGAEMQQDLTGLAMFPRISLGAGSVRVQRTETIEAGYRKTAGSRTFSASVYRDRVGNAAVTMMGVPDAASASNLLPDIFSDSWTLNAGHYRGLGYRLAFTQNLGGHLDFTAAYGGGDALAIDRAAAPRPEDLQGSIREARRHSVTARVSGSVPGAGTRFAVSYQIASIRTLTPEHMYLTQSTLDGIGLNIHVRQPLPYLGGLPGHVEAMADLSNLLADGYVPINADGRQMCLMHTPRTVRGGFNFVF
jgi:hypothetical protein